MINPAAHTKPVRINRVPVRRLTLVHLSRRQTVKPAAAHVRASGKIGRRNRAIPEAKPIPRFEAIQTNTRTRDGLSILKARSTNGAKISTVGPKKYQRPAPLGRTPARNRNGRTCRTLWLADVPVSA